MAVCGFESFPSDFDWAIFYTIMDHRLQKNHKLVQTLKDRFKQKEALIGVIGLGYVG
jgi:hypothetical protein